MTLLLLKQIISMMIMIGCGMLLVKTGKVKSENSETLSIITIYLILPCLVVNSFQIEITPNVRKGFLAAVAAAVLIHILLLILCRVFRAVWHLQTIEEASVFYSNCGNMIIPLVASVLGKDMVIYASAFVAVQTILIWTHGHVLISGKKASDWKAILTNPNLIAIAIGLVLFAFGIKLPEIILIPLDGIASVVGPVSMFTIGMIISRVEWKRIFVRGRLYLIMVLKMIAVPAAVLALLFLLRNIIPLENGKEIFLVSFLAVTAPTATSVMQMANVYHTDAVYAGMINAMTTVVCVFTMPAMVMLYERLMP